MRSFVSFAVALTFLLFTPTKGIGQEDTVSDAATTASAMVFIPITPCRIADTRYGSGQFGGPEMSAGSTRTFNIPQSACSIPSTAAAYSLNITALPDKSLSYLTLWPAGQPQPGVSTLNSDGRTKANAAIIPAGTNGGVSIFVTDATQVIIDINGYFVPNGTASGLAFTTVTQCRIVDTRGPATGPLAAPYITGGSTRSFPILSSSCIPSGATPVAYSLNVTALPHKTLEYLTAWSAGQTKPGTSTLNSSTGTDTANAAIVKAGTNGEISIFVSDDSDVLIDINGYFAPAADIVGVLYYYPVTPCRVLDSRNAIPPGDPFPGRTLFGIQGSPCAPPSTAAAYILNATLLPGGSFPYLLLWPVTFAPQPDTSTLNAIDGAVTSNMAIVETDNGDIYGYGDGPGNIILDYFGYFGLPPQ